MAKLPIFSIKIGQFLLKNGHFGLKMATDKNVSFKLKLTLKCSYEHLELGLYHFWLILYSQAIFALNFVKILIPEIVNYSKMYDLKKIVILLGIKVI